MPEHLRELLAPGATEVLPLTTGAAAILPPGDVTRKVVVESVYHGTEEYSVFRPAKPLSRFLSKGAQARCAARSKP